MAKIAVVLADDFEDSEFRQPADCLKNAGHELTIVGMEAGATVTGKKGKERVQIDCTAQSLLPSDYDALLIPGGFSPDHLRMDTDIVSFVRAFHATGHLIAAVCHGPQLLIEAEVVRGHRLTSWPSVRRDLLNAGADVVDEAVVEHENLITSRKPDDLPAFCDAILARLQQQDKTPRPHAGEPST